jgi:hypothetical protein
VVNENHVEVGKGIVVTIDEAETDLTPGKKVIIYKQGISE